MKKSSAWFMLTPGLVILFLFLAIPLLRVLFPSIFSGAYPFDAYVGFFQDEYYRKIFIRTVKIAVITTFVCMVGGIPTAYFISRCSKKWRGILLAASIFPMMTNSVIRSFAWINILGSNGIINKVLVGLGVVPKPLKLLYTDFSIIIGSVYLFLPLMIVTVAGVMENIDDDMMEAALSLGAARMEAFMKVIFPMSLPGIIVGGILVFTGTPATVTIIRGRNRYTDPMMTNSVIRSFAWINILGSNGIINKVLVGLGVVPKPLKLLYTDFSIIIGSVYLFLPLMIVTVAGVMENIDDDMMEAALSLGAARMEAFMKVIFPMSLPGIIVGGILVFTGTLTAYTTPQLLGRNSNMVMATLIYQRAMSVSDWTGASVIALIMIVVTLAVIRGFNALAAKLDRRGENYA